MSASKERSRTGKINESSPQVAAGKIHSIIQLMFTMVIFSLFFGGLAHIPSDNFPYPIFGYAALVPWTFLANGLGQLTNILIGESNLMSILKESVT